MTTKLQPKSQKLEKYFETNYKTKPFDDTKWWVRNSHDEYIESVWVNDSQFIATKIKPNMLPDFLNAGWVEGKTDDHFFVPQDILRWCQNSRDIPQMCSVQTATHEYLKSKQLMRTFLFESDLREAIKNCDLHPLFNDYKKMYLQSESVKHRFRKWYIGEIETQINPKTKSKETCLYLISPIRLVLQNTLDIPPTRVEKLRALMDNGDFSVEREYESACSEEHEDDCRRRDAVWIE